MACLVLLEVQSKPDNFDTLKQAFRSILPDTRAYDGLQRLTVNEDAANNTLVLVEEWDSSDHHKAYMNWRTERGDIEKLVALLAGPPSVRYLDMTDI